MARTKKCDECKKDCVKNEMVQIDYFTRKNNVKTKMYCSIECATAKETRKQLIEDTNNLLESILEMPIRNNMYFNKLYSPIITHYGYKVIYDMLHSEYGHICESLNKDFVTVNAKIKYFMAIVQNKIEDYKKVDVVEKKEEETNIEFIEMPTVKFNKKEKKSIFDI